MIRHLTSKAVVRGLPIFGPIGGAIERIVLKSMPLGCALGAAVGAIQGACGVEKIHQPDSLFSRDYMCSTAIHATVGGLIGTGVGGIMLPASILLSPIWVPKITYDAVCEKMNASKEDECE